MQKKESGKKGVITYSFKEKKPPIIFARVQNRGWFKNKKNNKIHFFDNKGFTPSLKYLKNDTEFNNFTRNLESFDIQQLTPELFYSKVSKKKGNNNSKLNLETNLKTNLKVLCQLINMLMPFADPNGYAATATQLYSIPEKGLQDYQWNYSFPILHLMYR